MAFSTFQFTLNNGIKIPGVGLGTYRIRHSGDVMKAIEYALDAGYRMFDTAAVYGNERHIKEALQYLLPKYGLERSDIFITTKLSPSNHGGPEITEKACMESLKNLGLDYVDLYLIHFPGSAGLPSNDIRNKKYRDITWSGLEALYKNGKARAIGVSNFTTRHLKELIGGNHDVIPAVNQVEWHPYYRQEELLQYCKEKGIVLQAYCSFGGTSSSDVSLLQDPTVIQIASKLKVTSAQLLLVWALQQGVAVIPKSTNRDRVKQNISLNFTIPDEDLKLLNALGNRNTKYAWNPDVVA